MIISITEYWNNPVSFTQIIIKTKKGAVLFEIQIRCFYDCLSQVLQHDCLKNLLIRSKEAITTAHTTHQDGRLLEGAEEWQHKGSKKRENHVSQNLCPKSPSHFTHSQSFSPWGAQSLLLRSCSFKGSQQRFWGAKQSRSGLALTLMEWGGGSACLPLTPGPQHYSLWAGKDFFTSCKQQVIL